MRVYKIRRKTRRGGRASKPPLTSGSWHPFRLALSTWLLLSSPLSLTSLLAFSLCFTVSLFTFPFCLVWRVARSVLVAMCGTIEATHVVL